MSDFHWNKYERSSIAVATCERSGAMDVNFLLWNEQSDNGVHPRCLLRAHIKITMPHRLSVAKPSHSRRRVDALITKSHATARCETAIGVDGRRRFVKRPANQSAARRIHHAVFVFQRKFKMLNCDNLNASCNVNVLNWTNGDMVKRKLARLRMKRGACPGRGECGPPIQPQGRPCFPRTMTLKSQI